jgi:hypothetical protein
MSYIINKNIHRIITLLIVILIIQPPFNSWEKLILLSLSSTIIFFSEIKNFTNKNNIIFILIFIIIFLFQFFFSKNYLIVNHVVLPTTVNTNFDYLKDNFPKDLEKKLKFELKKLENEENLLKKIPQPGSNELSTLFKIYAFQAENLWTNLEEGKYVLIEKNLDFWELGPSALNDTNLNIRNLQKPNPKNNVVFPVLFKLNFKKNNNRSDLCFTGNLYYKFNNRFIFLDKKKNECIKINYKTDYYFLDYKRDLKINVKNNFFYDNNYIFFYISTLILISILLLNIYKINLFYIFLSLSFFLVLYLYLKFSPNSISGFSETFYFARGNDGLMHYGYARIMANHFILGNFYEGLKGVEGTFNFMPLLRYINTFLFIFFGDTVLGSIFLISFFPILILKMLSLFLKFKASKYLVLIFLFFPIFESLGFTMINYINFTVDGYGEGISYLFLNIITYLYFKKDDKKIKFFLIGLFSIVVIGIRPNYLGFLCPLMFTYVIYLCSKKNQIKEIYQKIFLLFLGFSFIILIPLHNYIYSNEIALIIKNAGLENNFKVSFKEYIEFFQSFFSNNKNNLDHTKILLHLNHYIKIYELWFLIILLNLFFVFLFKIDLKLKLFSLSLILMHTTFLFFLGDPRYSMGTWMLSFIVFLYMFKEKYYFLIKKNFKKLDI